jgi:hypothetical protein
LKPEENISLEKKRSGRRSIAAKDIRSNENTRLGFSEF